jgi:S-ribosylhomocysteine lyase LuxS involved in autoinducer biosynthesis
LISIADVLTAFDFRLNAPNRKIWSKDEFA